MTRAGLPLPGQNRNAFGVAIAGTGMGVPGRVVTNTELAQTVETNDEWIIQRTGIKQRNVVTDGQSLRTICADALNGALADAGKKPSDLSMLILATLTPEMTCPSTAARVVADVGAVPAGAIEISAACSGFVYGLNMAVGMMYTGWYDSIAVIGGETLSRILNWKDRGTCILFGDGAAAALLCKTDDPSQGCIYQSTGSNGNGWVDLYIPRDEKDLPTDGKSIFNGQFNTLQMNGREVFKFAVSTLQNAIDGALKAAGLAPSDLAMVISHQSNARILEAARDKVGLTTDQLYINIDRYGNTSAASVPICLHELRMQKRLKKGDLVLFIGLGGGLTWASSLWRL
jgi:3-oxoacyl-[acyl-carrier-protein] synthase III